MSHGVDTCQAGSGSFPSRGAGLRCDKEPHPSPRAGRPGPAPRAPAAAVIEIFVDGDGCPVKDETYVVATRHGVPVTVVANARMSVPRELGVQLVVVDRGPDAADDFIVAHVRAGDVVVTADIPLAARCLEAGAAVLGTHGRPFDRESIGGQLSLRAFKEDLRGAGVQAGGPPPLSDRDRSLFLSKLEEMVQRAVREDRARSSGSR